MAMTILDSYGNPITLNTLHTQALSTKAKVENLLGSKKVVKKLSVTSPPMPMTSPMGASQSIPFAGLGVEAGSGEYLVILHLACSVGSIQVTLNGEIKEIDGSPMEIDQGTGNVVNNSNVQTHHIISWFGNYSEGDYLNFSYINNSTTSSLRDDTFVVVEKI